MEPRIQRCRGCGSDLRVPLHARSFRCAVCNCVTAAQPPGRRPSNSYALMEAPKSIAAAPRSIAPVPAAHGRKRALLIGVNYYGKSYGLRGTINDVKCMRYLLVQKFGFPANSILTLTEHETDRLRIPTKENIRAAMRWLVQGCSSGDSLVFYYSGHGDRLPDNDNDEIDGYDEALCPVDHESEGVILDDEINAVIVRPLPKGATLHAIIDACYSGTMLDLPYLCRVNREGLYMWEDQRVSSSVNKGTSGGLAICLSSSEDNQISADTTAFTKTTTRTGAMTFSFIQAIENCQELTYGGLLNAMRSAIRSIAPNSIPPFLRFGFQLGFLVSKALNALPARQQPQLSTSERFEIYSKPFIL